LPLIPPSSVRRGLIPRLTQAVFCILALAALSGCGSTGPAVRTEFRPFSAEEAALDRSQRGARYTLQPGDVVTVSFKYEKDLDQNHLRVLPDGRFTMSGAEDIKVVGMTISELDSVLTGTFAADYVAPELSVIMEEFGAQQVFVLGEVGAPGQYKLPDQGRGVLQAVAMAGGFSQHASTSEVLLVRVVDGGFEYKLFDVSHLEKEGLRSFEAMDVRPNDIIYVPRSTLGDLGYFHQTVLRNIVDLGDLFWDIYAIVNIEDVDRLYR